MPYDRIVHGVLCATSRDGRTPEDWLREVKEIEEAAQKGFPSAYAGRASLDLFWRVGKVPTLEQLGERTAAAFLGVRLECAQCHKHPFDRWTQADYRAYANVFGQVTVGASPEPLRTLTGGEPATVVKGNVIVKGQAIGVTEVFVSAKKRTLPHPDFVPVSKTALRKGEPPPAPMPLPARALGGPEIPVEPGKDARERLFAWMRSPDNAYFARSFVNRVWAHYFGIGLVHPADDFSLANPPSNARLLDALAKDFIEHNFDIRHLERTVLNSRTYQLSSDPNETNKLDHNNYSHSFLRPLMAEVAVDVLNSALGVRDTFGEDAPPGSRAIEVGASRVQNPNLAYAFRVFGRPTRAAVCDCERAGEPALAQTLFLMTDPAVLEKLRATVRPGKGKQPPPPGK